MITGITGSLVALGTGKIELRLLFAFLVAVGVPFGQPPDGYSGGVPASSACDVGVGADGKFTSLLQPQTAAMMKIASALRLIFSGCVPESASPLPRPEVVPANMER